MPCESSHLKVNNFQRISNQTRALLKNSEDILTTSRKFLSNRTRYILLTNWEWGHYREISDQGLDGQYIKAEVWDFPVMTEQTRSYLLCGLFSSILKKYTIKTPEVVFPACLRGLRLSSWLILKKYLYANFFFQLLKVWLYFVHLFCCFHPLACCITHNSKELSRREKIS